MRSAIRLVLVVLFPLFLPSASFASFPLFLTSLFVLASGIALA